MELYASLIELLASAHLLLLDSFTYIRHMPCKPNRDDFKKSVDEGQIGLILYHASRTHEASFIISDVTWERHW